MSDPSPTHRIAFVCVENANRSQMAEAFARVIGRGRVEAYSAGSRGGGQVNSKAVESMRRIGYDLSTHRSKPVSEIEDLDFDTVVTMGCGDACPNLRARQRLDWQIPDPRELELRAFDAVRDQIGVMVRELLGRLTGGPT